MLISFRWPRCSRHQFPRHCRLHKKLTTAHINLSKKFPLCTRKSSTSGRKKENKRKVRKTKDKRLKQRARHLLGNLSSIEVAGQIFGSESKRMIEGLNGVKRVA